MKKTHINTGIVFDPLHPLFTILQKKMIVSQTELYQSYVLINNQVLSTLHTLKLKLTIKHRENDEANSITQKKQQKDTKFDNHRDNRYPGKRMNQ